MMSDKAFIPVIFVRCVILYKAFVICFDFFRRSLHLISRCELGMVGMHQLRRKAPRAS